MILQSSTLLYHFIHDDPHDMSQSISPWGGFDHWPWTIPRRQRCGPAMALPPENDIYIYVCVFTSIYTIYIIRVYMSIYLYIDIKWYVSLYTIYIPYIWTHLLNMCPLTSNNIKIGLLDPSMPTWSTDPQIHRSQVRDVTTQWMDGSILVAPVLKKNSTHAPWLPWLEAGMQTEWYTV